MSIKEKLVELVRFRMVDPQLSVEEIDKALQLSLSAFNMVPHITYFTIYDAENVEQISDILVNYAAYVLCQNKSVIERINSKKNIYKDGGGYEVMSPDMSNDYRELARDLWHSWWEQVNNLKQTDNFYDEFVKE
jgi:hypothetical protein